MSAYPTDARLLHKARVAPVRLARRQGIALRQSYERIGRAAFVRSQRYAHARQIIRANTRTRKLRTNHSTFSKNRDRLMELAVVERFFTEVMSLADQQGLSKEHSRWTAP